jgi:hypothetical protein
LSLVALVWQVASWRLTGSIVRVDVGKALLTVGGDLGPNVLTVRTRNVGRTAVEVDGWGFQVPATKEWLWPTASSAWRGPQVPSPSSLDTRRSGSSRRRTFGKRLPGAVLRHRSAFAALPRLQPEGGLSPGGRSPYNCRPAACLACPYGVLRVTKQRPTMPNRVTPVVALTSTNRETPRSMHGCESDWGSRGRRFESARPDRTTQLEVPSQAGRPRVAGWVPGSGSRLKRRPVGQ